MSDTPAEDYSAFDALPAEEWQALAAAGWGEGDGQDHHVPPDLLELHEVLEWQAAVAAAEGGES